MTQGNGGGMSWSQFGWDDLVKLWDDLCSRSMSVDESLKVDFDLGMVHPRRRSAADNDDRTASGETSDFDLGEISPRRSAESEEDAP